VSGSVRLVVRAVAKVASYEWQHSADGGKTWIDAGITVQAQKTISGLEPGKTYRFRYRPITRRGGPGDWSDPFAFIVR
jgi:hypothetical protein